jgi:hypothetical protein
VHGIALCDAGVVERNAGVVGRLGDVLSWEPLWEQLGTDEKMVLIQ